MSATATSASAVPSRPAPSHATPMTWFADTWQMIKRNLIHIRRTPELLLDVTLSPIMFVLLFNFVFGGAISVGGTGGTKGQYINFLMAGIFVQTIAFAGVYTGVLLANDLKNGMIDRFRSLPMAQSSVLTGRTLTDVMRATLAIAIMWIVGLLVASGPRVGRWEAWQPSASCCCSASPCRGSGWRWVRWFERPRPCRASFSPPSSRSRS